MRALGYTPALYMYSLAEIKIWARWWLLSYRIGESSCHEHLAIIEKTEAAMKPYLDSPDEALRLTARSVAQYRAQSALRPRQSLIVTEFLSYALLPLGLMRWLIEGLIARPKRTPRAAGVRWNQSYFRYTRSPDIFHTPPELAKDAPQTVFVTARYLRRDDVRFLWQATRTAWPMLGSLRFQWIFKIAKEIAWARPLIDAHPSDYALLDAECNCALSLLTLYSHRHGQKLYDVQHGDLFVSAVNTFFETDRCYVWDDFYTELLKQMRARSDFRVYTNPTFLLSDAEKAITRHGIGVFMPGAMTLDREEDRRTFAEALNALTDHAPVRLRPHPAYINECAAIAPLLSSKVEITDSRLENSKQFILRHEVIVGTVSAAILESIMLGQNVVCFRGKFLDDIASYHFSYRKPNCRLCDLPSLADTVREYFTPTARSQTPARPL